MLKRTINHIHSTPILGYNCLQSWQLAYFLAIVWGFNQNLNAVILKGRVMVRGTKIKILKWEILFNTNPRRWGHYMGCFQQKKILVNFCWLIVDLAHDEFKNVLKNGSQIETWGLFKILGLGVPYFGERSPIPPGPLYGLYFENRKKCFVKNRENNVFWPFWGQKSLRISAWFFFTFSKIQKWYGYI